MGSRALKTPLLQLWAANLAGEHPPQMVGSPRSLHLVGFGQRGVGLDLAMDTVDRNTRSRMMASIRGKDTKPEMAVRKAAHSLGLRYRLHRRDLPGSPDLVFPSRRKVIFVHGCYWHRHAGCRLAYSPKTNVDFWNAKFNKNVVRDAEALFKLKADGWDAWVIWECETTDIASVKSRLLAHFSCDYTNEN